MPGSDTLHFGHAKIRIETNWARGTKKIQRPSPEPPGNARGQGGKGAGVAVQKPGRACAALKGLPGAGRAVCWVSAVGVAWRVIYAHIYKDTMA